MKHWKTKSRKLVIKNRWLSLYADTCELPDGRIVKPYYVMEEKDCVHVVAINSRNEILLTRQYRHGARVVCSELPCGFIEPKEAPLAAAKRELKEETGYIARTWTKLSVLFTNPGRQTNRVHCFLARGLKRVGAQSLDGNEDISFEFMLQAEVMRRIRKSDFTQALHVSSYLLAMNALQNTPVKHLGRKQSSS